MSLPSGTYRLFFDAPDGYRSRWYGPGAGSRIEVGQDGLRLVPTPIASDVESTLTGRVLNFQGDYLDDVIVRASVDGVTVATARTYGGPTAEHGYFELHAPAGELELSIDGRHLGYTRVYTDVVAGGGLTEIGEYALDRPGAVLRGAVTEADGSPASRANVRVFRMNDRGNFREVRRAVTNRSGRYVVSVSSRLLPAQFTVCAMRQYAKTCLGGGDPNADHVVPLASGGRAVADPVVLGDTVVSGRFVDAEGDPVSLSHVFLTRYEPAAGPGDEERINWRYARIFDVTDGRFAFTVVHEGFDYTVCGRSDGPAGVTTCYGDVGDEESARRFAVPETGEVTLGDITINGAVIAGDIVDLDGELVERDVYVDLYRIEADRAIQVSDDGSVGGSYRIAAQRTADPDVRYTVCVWAEGVGGGNSDWCLSDTDELVSDPLQAATFTLPPAREGRMFDLVTDFDCLRCGTPTALVKTPVRTRAGDPVAGAVVVAYQRIDGEWIEAGEWVGDVNGNTRARLVAGTYTLRYLRAGMEPVFLGGDAEMPAEPTAENSIVIGSDLAPVTLGTVTLQRQRPTFGTAVAGEYGPGHDYCLSRFLPKNDDGSSEAVVAPFPMTFFGGPQSELFVNNNGNITFGEPLGDYTPSAFGQGDSYEGPPIIAPFFADVDTWNDGSNVVTYGSNASGTKLCVNWTDVGYYDSWSDKLNSFQLILTKATGADRAPGDFDIQFNYDRILWETGDASGGRNGFGGTSALAGFTAGTPDIPGTVVQLPGSLVNGALLDSGPNALVRGTLNAGGRAGRYNFAVNNSGVEQRLGSLEGRIVTSDGASPDPVLTGVAGALVEPCRQVSGSLRCYGSARTAGDGRFTFVGLPGGVAETGAVPETAEPIVYTLRVSPPAGSSLFPAVGTGGVKAGLANVVTDPIVMAGPRAVPPGVRVETDPTSSQEGFPPRVRDDGVLEMYWRTSLALSVPGCPEQTPTFSFTVGGTTVDSGPMTEVPGTPLSTYTATVQRPFPLAGDGSLTTTVLPSCASDSTPVAFDVYIDPSGTVTDQFGMPLDDVTATLLRSDTVGGPFAPVPDGSAIMSPANRTNPDVLDSDGAFAWFVQSGVYRVDATRTGCDAASTEEMPVPPERLALLIKMQCDGRMVSATTAPALSAATARQGTALTVTPATWPAPIEPTRIEWRRGNTVVGTQATYTPTSQDAGLQLTVRTYGQRPEYRQENRDDGALVTFEESFASVQTAVVEALPGNGGGPVSPAITNTAKPAITGTAKVGGQLSADPGTWNSQGLTFGYQWSRDGAPIAGATGATYAPVVADLDKAVTVTVTASKTGLTSGTASADPVTVGKGAAPQNTGAKPLVTGTPEVGETLTVSDGTWDLEELTFAYQWLRDGEPIEGATAATYVVTTDDLGAELTARATASKTGHEDASVLASGLTVPDEEEPPVDPAASTTKAKLQAGKVTKGERGIVRVQVSGEGESVPTGTITITAGPKSVEVTLTEADNGKVKVTLPKLKPGKYEVSVSYSGDEATEGSADEAGTLKVKEKKKGKKGKGKKGKGKTADRTGGGRPMAAFL